MHSDYTIDNRQRTNTEREGFRRLNLLVGVPSKRLERPAKTGSGILKLFVQGNVLPAVVNPISHHGKGNSEKAEN